MCRTRYKNIANKTRNEEDIRRYKRQRNKIVKLNKVAKKRYFRSLDPATIGSDKRFWKTFKPLFSNKPSNIQEKIILVENGSRITCDKQIAECFNEYFVNITSTLPIEAYVTPPSYVPLQDPVLNAINKYDNHPSVVSIRNNVANDESFEFHPVNPTDVWNEIRQLDNLKTTSGCISVDILKLISDLCHVEITKYFNKMLLTCEFPEPLKSVDVSSLYKSSESTCKVNYRPISVATAMSKVFERLIAKQINSFVTTKISSLLCAYRKGHSAQHALIRLIETIRKTLDRKGVAGMILMDLSKAFDCMPHDLLIAKLKAYGFGLQGLRLIANYLSDRKQRVKVGSTYSDWLQTKTGVPQGSVLGPLLFNIFLNDFIYIVEHSEVCNFADDNTIFSCDDTFESVASNLKQDMSQAISWFKTNQMVANPSKFQVMLLGLKTDDSIVLDIGSVSIDVVSSVELLGITIDSKLKFDHHVAKLCQKANNKISAFSRISHYLNEKQSRLLYNSFIMSQFNYCPLIWMFCGKVANNDLNRTHKRALRILLNDHTSTFNELLHRVNECTIHQKNLQKLMLEVYNSLTQQNPSFLWDMFHEKDNKYNLRSKNLLMLPPNQNNYLWQR